MNKRVTIKDIAEQAGVSVGTVDRVIHNRGRVAHEVQEKVLSVMTELDFEPNLIASTLAFNRIINIGVLMPTLHTDPYWDQPLTGMRRSRQAVKHYGITLVETMFDLFNPQDFQKKAFELIAQKPDALVFPPIFLKEALNILDYCAQEGIPTILINTDIEHPQVMSYIGQDSFQSGVLAGKLLHMSKEKRGGVLILNLDKETTNAKHLLDKERGLRHFFEPHLQGKDTIVRLDLEAFDSPGQLKLQVAEALKQHKHINSIFVSNSRAYKLVEAFEGQSLSDLCVLGFDLLPQNLHCLKSEKIDFLINQNAGYQGYFAIKKLTDFFIFKKKLPRVHYLPLDIVVAENVDYYIQHELGS